MTKLFFRLLDEMRQRNSTVTLLDQWDAARALSYSLLHARVEAAEGKRSKASVAALTVRMAREVEQKTMGLPFRLDLPSGPVFLWEPLFVFAGCTGPQEGWSGAADDPSAPDDPTWDGRWEDWRNLARARARVRTNARTQAGARVGERAVAA